MHFPHKSSGLATCLQPLLRRSRPALNRDLRMSLPSELVTGLAVAINVAVDEVELDLSHELVPFAKGRLTGDGSILLA